MPRIPPITGKADVAPEHHGVVDQVLTVFGNVRGPFSMLLHSPKLAERMLGLVPFFRESSIVETRLRLPAILAIVREREADYVWAAQVRFARQHGVRDEVIDLLRRKGDTAGLAEDERAVIDFARALARTNKVDQPTFGALKGRYGAQWMVELAAAVNFYGALCGIANTFEVPAPPDGDRFR